MRATVLIAVIIMITIIRLLELQSTDTYNWHCLIYTRTLTNWSVLYDLKQVVMVMYSNLT